MGNLTAGAEPHAFGYDAAADSLARMKTAGVDEAELMDGSLVVPAAVDAGPVFARMRVLILSLFIAGIVALLAGIVLFVTLDGPVGGSNTTVPGTGVNQLLGETQQVLAGASTLGGVLLLVLMPFALKTHVNKALAMAHDQWTAVLPEATYFNVNIEDAKTYDKFKVLADDYGVAWFDKLGSRLLIEGLRYRYFILREDLLDAKIVKAGGSQGVEIAVRLSEQCELKMTIICEQVRQELKKQIALPGKSVLVRMMEETFDVVVTKR